MHIRELLRKVYLGDLPQDLDVIDFSGIVIKAKSLQIGKLFSKGGFLLNWVANSIDKGKSKQNMNFNGLDIIYVNPSEGTITSIAAALDKKLTSGFVSVEVMKNGIKLLNVILTLDIESSIAKADVFEIDLNPGDRVRFVYTTSEDFTPIDCNLTVSAILEIT